MWSQLSATLSACTATVADRGLKCDVKITLSPLAAYYSVLFFFIIITIITLVSIKRVSDFDTLYNIVILYPDVCIVYF